MKAQTLRKTLAIVLSVLMLVSVMPLSMMAATTQSEEETSQVITIAGPDLSGKTRYAGLSMSDEIVNDTTLGRRMLKSTATASKAGGDNSYIEYDLSSYGVLAKSFPYMQIGYEIGRAHV